MLRVLFCITCCGAPPSNRPLRGRASAASASEKLVEQADFKSLITLGTGESKCVEQLLANQIQANNDRQQLAAKNNGADLVDEGKLASKAQVDKHRTANNDETQLDGDSLLEASTSALLLKVAETAEANQEELNNFHEKELSFYDERSISPPSSIDIEPFKEVPNNEELEEEAGLSSQGEFEAQKRPQRGETVARATTISGSQEVLDSSKRPIVELAETVRINVNVPSTTKIGDYARIEYSPVEDLDSVTGQSRANSVKEGAIVPRRSSSNDSDELGGATSGDLSRRSSRGVESTSISISSQLSNEQLQQNITSMLDSSSPLATFGTIGLPLGPPWQMETTETAKTSPATTGAALTNNSQDSLSGGSLNSYPVSQATSMGGVNEPTTIGGALVGDSMERSYMEDSADVSMLSQSQASSLGNRDSTLSMATTATTSTTGGLTNPTPTPSELSNSGSVKKAKQKAKSLFKKLKPGSKKNKGEIKQ